MNELILRLGTPTEVIEEMSKDVLNLRETQAVILNILERMQPVEEPARPKLSVRKAKDE